MEERLAGYVADLAAFDVGQGYPTFFEALHVVEFGGRVDGGALVPVGAVGCESVIHDAFIMDGERWGVKSGVSG